MSQNFLKIISDNYVYIFSRTYIFISWYSRMYARNNNKPVFCYYFARNPRAREIITNLPSAIILRAIIYFCAQSASSRNNNKPTFCYYFARNYLFLRAIRELLFIFINLICGIIKNLSSAIIYFCAWDSRAREIITNLPSAIILRANSRNN